MLIELKILTPTNVASSLGYSTGTIYKHIKAGALRAYRENGHRYKIFEDDLADYLEWLKPKK